MNTKYYKRPRNLLNFLHVSGRSSTWIPFQVLNSPVSLTSNYLDEISDFHGFPAFVYICVATSEEKKDAKIYSSDTKK